MSRVVIITGAGSGIGRALAGRLAARGDHLLLLDIDAAAVAEVAARLDPVARAAGGSADHARVDVREADAVQGAVDLVWDRFGRLDVLVNNAGIGLGGTGEELSAAHWQRMFDINLSGVMHGVAAAYPRMVAAGHGQLVNIASLAGLVPAPFLAGYAASKHGVVGLSLSLAAEAAGTGVSVTCVCPGFTDTAILDFHGPADLPRTSAAGRGRIFAARIPGGIYEVEDLARDIERGMDARKLMVVTPASARWLWRGMRLSPRLGTALASVLARRTRAALAVETAEAEI